MPISILESTFYDTMLQISSSFYQTSIILSIQHGLSTYKLWTITFIKWSMTRSHSVLTCKII